jgi:hypothetical protein
MGTTGLYDNLTVCSTHPWGSMHFLTLPVEPQGMIRFLGSWNLEGTLVSRGISPTLRIMSSDDLIQARILPYHSDQAYGT